MPPLGGARKIPTENKDSFLAPSGGRCSISIATGVSGSSGLQRNITCSVASCHLSGHRTSNIPPSKRSVKTSAPFREAGSVEATAKYISVGRKDCREGLQDSVCISASAFQRRGLHFRETGTSAFVDTGVASSAGQRGHRTCSPARQRVRLLQPVFSGSQERWGVASNFRSSRIEPLPQILQVQNVDNQDDCVSDPIGGLVRDNRSQGRIFSRRNIATTQEVPEVRFRGRSLPVSGSLSCSEDNVFGGCMGFDHDAGAAVSCTRRIHSKCPKEHQARPENYCSLPSEGSRSHGSCIHGDTLGPPADEIVSVVAQSQGISSKGQSPEANKGYAPGASYPFYVVQTPVSDFGSHSRSVLSSQDANDRRFPHGLGCGLGWPSSPRDLERPSSRMAHQLPRNDGSISGPEILPPAVERLPCPSAGGQHGGSLLHKSPGRTAFAPPEQTSAAGSALGTGQVPVPQGDLHPRAYECGSRFSVQTSCDTWGMETPPRSSQSNLGEILPSGGGPLCFTGDSTMSPLLLSDSSSPLGSGRYGPYVAQTGSLRISPDRSAPGSPGQGPSTGVSPLNVSVPLADQNMVLRSNIPPRRLAVGDPGQERSPISGTGDSISSPARALEPSCLAPEGDQLRDAGLPPDVVETILSARAPSTRRIYAFKWHIFENWCMAHHVDPVHCQVVAVLEFLQEKLSSGTCPGTLRIYVAAISACHVLIDGVSVGKHPLVARFIRGAKRLRPPN